MTKARFLLLMLVALLLLGGVLYASTPALATDIPYQAEDATLGGGVTVHSNVGGYYTGTGFVDFPMSGGYVEFPGLYISGYRKLSIYFRYALGSSSLRRGQLTVNGVNSTVTFYPTGGWDTWRRTLVIMPLNAGYTPNIIRLTSTGQGLPYLDRMDVYLPPEPTSVPGVPGVPPTSSPPTLPWFDPHTYYKIVNKADGLVLDSGGATVGGSYAKLYADITHDNLRWQIIETGGGWRKIVNKADGLVLDSGGATVGGSYAKLWLDIPHPNLRWYILDKGGGYYTIANEAGGLVLDSYGAIYIPGYARLGVNSNSDNVLWQIIPAD